MNEIILLVFKRVLLVFENTNQLFFESWWSGPFALGLILSPPLALIAKNGDFVVAFSPIGISKYE
jgi:hypothetical protein